MPINTANRHGPKRSPMTFVTPSARSANSELHWLMASSLAPAQSIKSSARRKIFEVNSVLSGVFSSSGTVGISGTLRKRNKLYSGSKDHKIGMINHKSSPIKRSKSVVMSTTPTCPQQ